MLAWAQPDAVKCRHQGVNLFLRGAATNAPQDTPMPDAHVSILLKKDTRAAMTSAQQRAPANRGKSVPTKVTQQ